MLFVVFAIGTWASRIWLLLFCWYYCLFLLVCFDMDIWSHLCWVGVWIFLCYCPNFVRMWISWMVLGVHRPLCIEAWEVVLAHPGIDAITSEPRSKPLSLDDSHCQYSEVSGEFSTFYSWSLLVGTRAQSHSGSVWCFIGTGFRISCSQIEAREVDAARLWILIWG